ncbi:uncharacterized protein DUF1707 [Nocardia tenerifensis]|uniref:Uncharacterized protein DUF1707 n=1 Tax=Nocardia tenerifensis TaxID=228006 RepID=A0A318K3G8_9NOCA|nr:DUF1707 domain-containing protein [Nocardia tenerifensis]PXX66361.1 uncharacterized protein DUF1707 [Nocardia tenerifensis]
MEDLPDIRIGTAEREAAMQRLSDHFAAGRLSVAEFDERSAVIAAAVTRGDLTPVFADLPDPLVKAAAVPAKPESGFLSEWPERVMAVIPILAVILFFVTHSWLWFLAIPLMGALLFGGGHGGHGHGRGHGRRRNRDRRSIE